MCIRDSAYTGPYRANHRYWTGLLLVTRLALLVTFSVNQNNNLSINLLAMTTVSVLLLSWFGSANWVYESPLNNFLEVVFLGNIGITSAAVAFNISNKKRSAVAIYISTSVTFVIFVGMVLYHVQRQLVLTKLGSRLKSRVLNALLPSREDSQGNEEDTTVEMRPASQSMLSQRNEVTSTIIEVAEPLQRMCRSYNSSELMEPLLELSLIHI